MNKETLIFILAFLMDAGAGLAGLCVPLLADRLGANYDDLGFIGATGAGVYALCCLFSGRIADRIGHRRTLVASSAGLILIYAIYTQVGRVSDLGMLAGAVGVFLAFYWPVLQAWLGHGIDRPRLLRALGGFNVAWSLGFFVGPAIGGHLFAMDASLPFAVVAGMCLVIFALVTRTPVRTTALPGFGPAIPESSRRDARFTTIAWVANFCTFYAVGNIRSIWPKYASATGIGPALLGDLLALIGLAQVAVFFLIARTARWQFKLWPIAAAQGLGIIGLFLLAQGHSPYVFALGLLLQGILVGITFTSSIFYSLNIEGPAGKRTGIHEAVVGSGFLLGPLAGGLLADLVGPRAPYLVAAGVLLIGIIVQAGIYQRGGRSAGHSPKSEPDRMVASPGTAAT